jgi:ribosomal protein L7/L12
VRKIIKEYLPSFKQRTERTMLDKTEEKVSKSKAEKRSKFVELAESRTINAIKAIRVIGKLGNRSAYEYSEADVKKIASALSREIEALKARMLQSGSKESVDFTLK